MQRKIMTLLLILFVSEKAFCVFATVNKWNTKVFKEKDNEMDIIATLVPGMLVTARKIPADGKIEVLFKGKKGWVQKSNLVIYDNVFSTLPPVSQNISGSQDEFYFYFNEHINKFNIIDKKIVKKQKIGFVQQIFPSTKNGLFIIEGVTTNEYSEIHNLQLYDFENERTVYIGSFNKKLMKIENFKFLKNSEYLAILFNVEGKRLICIYKTSNGEFVAYSTDAIGVFHIENIFLLSKSLSASYNIKSESIPFFIKLLLW